MTGNSLRDLIASIEGEYRRYKGLAEDAIAQVEEVDLARSVSPDDNSIAVIVWHISGNLKSRFTDFLTTNGEKPWRDRDSEFVARHVSRAELQGQWEEGWGVLFATLASLSDADLAQQVAIRRETLSVAAALHRSLARTSYHVGQIVYLAKASRGEGWKTLSIPRKR